MSMEEMTTFWLEFDPEYAPTIEQPVVHYSTDTFYRYDDPAMRKSQDEYSRLYETPEEAYKAACLYLWRVTKTFEELYQTVVRNGPPVREAHE